MRKSRSVSCTSRLRTRPRPKPSAERTSAKPMYSAAKPHGENTPCAAIAARSALIALPGMRGRYISSPRLNSSIPTASATRERYRSKNASTPQRLRARKATGSADGALMGRAILLRP